MSKILKEILSANAEKAGFVFFSVGKSHPQE